MERSGRGGVSEETKRVVPKTWEVGGFGNESALAQASGGMYRKRWTEGGGRGWEREDKETDISSCRHPFLRRLKSYRMARYA